MAVVEKRKREAAARAQAAQAAHPATTHP
jgi:hypothetical protein